ncbi:MAG: DUF2804 domain-containing protein [Coprobacillus sp.]
MRNHEITKKQPLLNKDGSLREPGWSRSLIQQYSRKDIKAAKFRIKEWDYYLIVNEDFGIAATLSDDGYIGLQSVSLLDFKNKWEHTETILNVFPMGKMKMPSSSISGITQYQDKRLSMKFIVQDHKRILSCQFKNFYENKDLSFEIELDKPTMDSMVIAIPWKDKKKAFYYNQKINCMRASGIVRYDNKTYAFDPKKDFGTLDWGRGVWTYDNTWFWGSGNMDIQGIPFGFNIGYGFGDNSAASENMLFYNHIAHKLDDVIFHIPKDYMQQWTITSSDKRFEMTFTPLLDRAAKISAIIVSSDQHQVFGYLNGIAVLDNGQEIKVQNMLCFLEDVHNKY